MKIKSSPEGEKIVTKKENRLIKLVFLLLGVLIGFLLSPVKKGTYISAGNHYFDDEDSKEKRRKSDEDTGH